MFLTSALLFTAEEVRNSPKLSCIASRVKTHVGSDLRFQTFYIKGVYELFIFKEGSSQEVIIKEMRKYPLSY